MGWIEVSIIFVLVIMVILYGINVSLIKNNRVRIKVDKEGMLFSNDDLSVKEPVDLSIGNIFTSVGYTVNGPVLIKVTGGQVVTYLINGVEKQDVILGDGTLRINEVGVISNLRVQ